MAGRWANAALYQQHWPTDLRLNNSTVPDELMARITQGGLARSITQASTLQIKVQDGDRTIMGHEAANPFTGPPNWVYGIPNGFNLVQFAKQGDALTLTAEDAVINKLRTRLGPRASNPGTTTFVQFCAQLCGDAGVPFIADYNAAPLQVPVSVGGPQAASGNTAAQPAEDYWTALTRLASDRGWYCFSDGTSVLMGPDDWLLSWGGAPAVTICEAVKPVAGALQVDTIDGEADAGKPVQTISVTTRASEWAGDPGSWIRVVSGLGPLTGDWICTDINRQNLASDQLAVSLAAPTPPKPEPQADSSASTTAAAPASSGAGTGASNPASFAHAHQPGYVEAEDGSWVPASYYS